MPGPSAVSSQPPFWEPGLAAGCRGPGARDFLLAKTLLGPSLSAPLCSGAHTTLTQHQVPRSVIFPQLLEPPKLLLSSVFSESDPFLKRLHAFILKGNLFSTINGNSVSLAMKNVLAKAC